MDCNKFVFHLITNQNHNKNNLAILSPNREATSYQNLAGHLNAITLQITQMGFRTGDRIALVLPNGPEMATLFLAISAVCTCVPLNPAFLLEDFNFCLEDFQVKALFTDFAKEHPSCVAAEILGIPVVKIEPDEHFAGIFSLSSNLSINGNILETTYSDLDDVALVLHTSGTTSRPKIVPLTHRNIYYSTQNIIETYQLNSSDRCLNMMPLFHIHGLIGAVVASLVSGGSVICTKGFLSDQIIHWLTDLIPTWYTAVPTIHQAVLSQIENQPENLKKHKLRFIRSCSSTLAPHIAENLERTFSVPVLEAYGMTEATHQIASNPLPPKTHKFGSVGMATGTSRVSIRNLAGYRLPDKEIGEICIRGENIMQGYENNMLENKNNFIGGWLRTGDLGYIDEEGYIFIEGRLKEIINHGGEKISPKEIDEVLLAHPYVKQAVAFGIPHPTLGEEVAAAVVLKSGKNLSMRELRKFSADRLTDYKVPRIIVFIQEIPKGATGKIQRIGLSEKLRSQLEDAKLNKATDRFDPNGPIEEKLVDIWKKVLKIESIGIQDDFLALGGDSIKLAQIIMWIQKEFNINLQYQEIYNLPTIELLAEMIHMRKVNI